MDAPRSHGETENDSYNVTLHSKCERKQTYILKIISSSIL